MQHLPIPIAALLAAAGTASATPWGAISEVGAFAVLAWYVWWVNTKTLPNQTKAFCAEAKEAREHASQQIDKLVKAWDVERTTHHEEVSALTNAITDLRINVAAQTG